MQIQALSLKKKISQLITQTIIKGVYRTTDSVPSTVSCIEWLLSKGPLTKQHHKASYISYFLQ